MRMEAIDSYRIAVELTCEDLKELNITFEEMDYGNIETRRVIWTLLDKARKTLHCDIDPSGRMLIEAVPMPDGGCILQFTLPQGDIIHAVRPCLAGESLVYEFKSSEDLLKASQRMAETGEKLDSELYLSPDDKYYRLIVHPNAPVNSVSMILSEHGELCGKGEFISAFTREHYYSVLKHDALEKIAD